MMTHVRFLAVSAFLTTVVLDCSLRRAEAQQASPPRIAAEPKDGLSINKPGAMQGYTLVAPMNSTSTYLIDMDGRIVNEWKSEFTPALSAYLLENGHLLRPGSERGFGVGGPGAGGRIQEFDWEGNLVWDYSFGESKLRPHHDIRRLPNGNVLVVASDTKTAEEAVAAGRRPESVREQLISECILEIKPTGLTTGEIVWKWHAWDHLIQDCDKLKPGFGDASEHPELVDLNFSTNMMDRMTSDPQQLARLRSLGYVGGGSTAQSGAAEKSVTDKPADQPDKPGSAGNDEARPTTTSRDGAKPAAQAADKSDAAADRRPAGRGPGGFGGPLQGDWLHVNSIAYNAKLDQIMISIHEFSEVWVIDHGTTTEQAATHKGGRHGHGGDLLYRWGNSRVYRSGTNADQRLFAQHSAHWIGEGLPGAGHLLVFNNGNSRPDGTYSSVDEVVLPLDDKGGYVKDEFVAFGPERAAWSYSAPEKSTFYSMLISGAQRLPNGNTFICSGNQGLLFEVTPSNEIVWQFKYPGAGFGGPGGGPPFRPGDLVPGFLRQILRVTVEQTESIQRLQAEVDSKLSTLLTDEQQKKRQQPPRFPFGPPGPLGGPPRPPGQGQSEPGAPEPRRERVEGNGQPRPFAFRPPRVGEVIPENLAKDLDLSESQTTELKSIQKLVDEGLATIWTDAQKMQLDEMEKFFTRGPGFGPPNGVGPPGQPGGPGRGPGGQGRGPAGPFGPGRGPGGIFRSYRYAADFAGLAGKELKPGKNLEEVAAASLRPGADRPEPRN